MTGILGAHAPAFDAAHFGIKVALVGLVQRQQGQKVAPAQLSQQCHDHLFVRVGLGELHHAAQVFLGKTASVLQHQLS